MFLELSHTANVTIPTGVLPSGPLQFEHELEVLTESICLLVVVDSDRISGPMLTAPH